MVGTSAILTIPSVSNQDVWLPVSDTSPDGTIVNPSGGTVEAAYTNGSDPSTWTGAVWETEPVVMDDLTYYLVRVGIGSAGLPIPKGYWFLWLKLNFITPSIVVRHSSILIY